MATPAFNGHVLAGRRYCDLLLTICELPPTPDEAGPPCIDNPASTARLGSPCRGGPAASFTTDGSQLFVSARHFEHGGVLDPPRGVTRIFFGRTSVTRTFDEQSGVVTGFTADVTVREGAHARVLLRPGRYWVWTTIGGDVALISCSRHAVRGAERVSVPAASPQLGIERRQWSGRRNNKRSNMLMRCDSVVPMTGRGSMIRSTRLH